MVKRCINGVWFNDFGSNNYSEGMHLISTDAAITPEEVLSGKFPGLYLNPSAPWVEDEAFLVYGTPEQYAVFYKKQIDSQISKKMMERFGWGLWPSPRVTDAYEEELRKNYKDWWKERINK